MIGAILPAAGRDGVRLPAALRGTGGAASSVPPWRIQGEEAQDKSDATSYPVNDNAFGLEHRAEQPLQNPAEYHLAGDKVGKRSGSGWNGNSPYPKTGYYKLAVEASAEPDGGTSPPTGVYGPMVVPFEEFQAVQFPYSLNGSWWSRETGEEPCCAVSEAGRIPCALSATLGGLRS